MHTVRDLAHCVGLADAPISVRALIGRAVPPLSLQARLSRVLQSQVDVNVIQVGVELFTPQDSSEIAFAIERTRALFASVDLGIGRITHYAIPLSETDGRHDIHNHAEADALWHWRGFPGAAIDLFFVRTYAGATAGRSPINGPCKQDGGLHGGLVIALEHIPSITGNLLAHELGHYLGLLHEGDPANLMFKSVPNGGALTAEQGQTLKRHCMVHIGCRQS